MEWSEYQQLASRTESIITNASEVVDNRVVRDLHGVIGLTTEVGELADSYKRMIFYGKRLDTINVEEEIGDILWYLALLCNSTGISLSKVMDRNIAKLKARYPDKFDSDKAINRDLDEERRVLEGKESDRGYYRG